LTDKDIQVTGKADISDIINQLPQNFNNDLGRTSATAPAA